MRRLIRLILAVAGLSLGSLAWGAVRPNIVAVVTDDQGQWAVGAYGNADCLTPNIDRLAREGALFTQAFACTPVCSPSRASYFSGRWPTEVGITDYLSPQENQEGLGLEAPIWPAVLQQHGYRTGLFGKWHLGAHPQFHPQRKGFDTFFGFRGGGIPPMNPTFDHGEEPLTLEGPACDLITNAALEFIRRHQREPFLVCLHFREPHLPFKPVPPEDAAPFAQLEPAIPKVRGADPQQLREWHRDYYACIHALDRNLGRVLRLLDDLQLTENTWVIFTSDHGYNNGRHGVDTKGNGQWIAGGIRGPKRPNMWDTSMKVPLVMRWPGVISPGQRLDDVVANIDMFRTVLGALNLPIPEGLTVHGLDFSPRLRGEPLPPRSALFGQYDLHNGGLAYLRMIRTDRYKLVRHFKARGLDELYDLQQDPDESQNLANAPQLRAVRRELEAQLHAWMESIDDPLLKSSY